MRKTITAVLVLLVILITAHAAFAAPVLNEIHTEGSDYIELFNDGDDDVNLSGWTLEDEVQVLITFEDGDIFFAGEIVALDVGNLLNKDGDAILLIDDSNVTIDSLTYGDVNDPVDAPHVDAPEEGEVIARFHDGKTDCVGDTGNVADCTEGWIVSDEATPDEENNRVIELGWEPVFNISEDYKFAIYASNFNFTDDDEDALDTITITKLPQNGTLTFENVSVEEGDVLIADNITNKNFYFIPGEDESGSPYAWFNYTLSDGLDESEEGTYTFVVHPVNDAPVVTGITTEGNTNITLQEGQENVITVVATDIDDDQEDLEVDEDLSTFDGVSFKDLDFDVEAEGLQVYFDLEGSELDVREEYDIEIVVSDGENESKQFDVEAYLSPAVEIIDESVQVFVNDAEQARKENTSVEREEFNVTPGDTVRIDFNYVNNLDGRIIGNVEIQTESSEDPDFAASEVVDWALRPQEPTAHSIEFTIPQNVVDDFEVEIIVDNEDAEGNSYQDNLELEFEIQLLEQSAHVQEIAIVDNHLTCIREASISANVTNNGDEDLIPELWVFDGPATFNVETGNFDRDPEYEAFQVLAEDALSPGETKEVPITVDLSSASNGEHAVYVYVVSPFFWDPVTNQFFVGGSEQLTVTVGDCLNQEALQEELTVGKNSQAGVTLDLLERTKDGYVYIIEDYNDNESDEIEDIDYEGILEFEVAEGQDEDLISCSIDADARTLRCDAPHENVVGTSALELNISSDDDISFTESTTVTVAEGLELTNVQINGNAMTSLQENNLTVKPLDEITVSFRLRNSLAERIAHTDVSLEVGFLDENGVSLHVDPGQETATQTFTVQVPANTVGGGYQAFLTATGTEENDVTVHTDSIELSIAVQQDAADVQLTASLAQGAENSVTCQTTVPVQYQLTNIGGTNEGDVLVTIREGATLLATSGEAAEGVLQLENVGVLAANGGTFSPNQLVQLPVRGIGSHTYTVEAQYNFNNNGAGNVAANAATPQTFTVSKSACITGAEPASPVRLFANEQQTFNVTVGEEGFENQIAWFKVVGEEEQPLVANGAELAGFSAAEAGEFVIKAVYNEDDAESHTWNVNVIDRPVTTLTVNYNADTPVADLNNFDLTAENTNGKIDFTETVDISSIKDLDEIITISNGVVFIDSQKEAQFANKGATITIKNFPQGRTVLYKFDSYDDQGNMVNRRVCDDCQIVSHIGTDLIFTVTGFSGVAPVNEQEVALSVTPTELEFANAVRGEAASTTVTITNTGTLEQMTGITYTLVGVNARFSAALADTVAALQPQQAQVVTLNITVPESQDAGRQKIGDLTVDSDQTNATTVPIYLEPQTFLSIESVKVKEPKSNKLTVGEVNEIEVKVKNEYSEDMEDVVVTVTILDVDGDDIEEESREFDIRDGQSEKVTIDFDLEGEKLDEDDYTVEVFVEGVAEDDDTEHEDETEATFRVDRDRHKVVITRATITPNNLQCSRGATLTVDIENVGENDEDDVEIRVSNSQLNMQLEKTEIEVDKYSRSNNDHRARFSLDLRDAAAGTYPVTVELYRGTKLDDTKDVTVTVQDCVTQQQASGNTGTVLTQPADNVVAQQLQQYLLARQQAQQQQVTTTSDSFREDDTYVILLGILVVLVLFALVLGLAVLMKKR